MIPELSFGSDGLILDFLENGYKDFAHIGNLNETNDYLSNVSKALPLESWDLSICGSRLGSVLILDPSFGKVGLSLNQCYHFGTN